MPENQIEEIKSKIDLVELVSSYVPLTKSGKNYKAVCPFHREKTPSFMVSPQLGIFKCFGCGEGGDALAFYQKIEGVSFGDALKELARRAGVQLKGYRRGPEEERREKLTEINQLAADYYHYLLTEHKVGETAREFFKRRGLKGETLERFNLGYAPEAWDNLGRYLLKKGYTLTEILTAGLAVAKEGGRGYFDFFRGRAMFPLRSPAGRTVGFAGRALGDEQPKYINTIDTPVFKKGQYLFNLDLAKSEIKRAKQAVLVEGEMDAIGLWQAGIKNVVASKGTALSPEQLTPLARLTQNLLICFDRDAAGLEATKKGLLLAQEAGLEVRAALLPEGKDPDELVREDRAGFLKILEKAPSLFDFYLASALARFERQTPEGKKRVAKEILPVLKSLANEVERAAYLNKIAEELEVGEEVLWRQLEKEEGVEVEPAAAAPSAKVPLPKREGYLLSLLFTLPEEKIRGALRKVPADLIADERLKEILTGLREYLKKVKRFRLASFSAKLSEEARPFLEELTLAPLSETDPEGEFVRTLNLLQRERLRRQRSELVAEVRRAEKEGQSAKVRRLQKQVLNLTKQIET